MNAGRRDLIRASTSALFAASSNKAAGDVYPSSPVKIVVPFSAGGIADVLVRRLAERLAGALGQAVVVDNRPGASGTIGMAIGATAKPDGYTLTFGSTSTLAVSPALGVPIKYDPLTSFNPIIQFGFTPMVFLTHPSVAVKSIEQFVALAKAKPGALTYSTGGATTTAHFTGELFKKSASIDVLHVPYKGSTQALTAILANEVSAGIDFPDTCAQHVAAGKLTALMITGARRIPILPGVPHAVEAGYPKLDILTWGGFLAPAGTPREIVSRLNREIGTILRSPEIREQQTQTGTQIVAGTPDDFRRMIELQRTKWENLVKVTGIKMEQ